MIKLDVRKDLKKLQRQLDDLAKKQLPFATATALTQLAKEVQAAEVAAIEETFDRPTPFTKKSVAIKSATKASQQAMVYVRDIAASYLAPFEFNGQHFLGDKRGLLVPKDIRLNQYGNLPRNALARLKGRADVFVGKVRLKNGETINGVWQRPPVGGRRDGTKGSKGNTQARLNGQRTGLKLLIRFEDALPVKEHLGYRERASKVVQGRAAVLLDHAIAKAIATARR